MAFSSIVNVDALDEGLILAPERYDPRRQLGHSVGIAVADIAEIAGEHVSPASLDAAHILVLDTSHAVEGFVRITPSNGTNPSLKSAKKRVRPGDVIISRLRPYLRQVAYVTPEIWAEDKGLTLLCSTEFYVLRSKDEQSIAFLVPFLLGCDVQKILSASQEGGHHPRFNADTLGGLMVPDNVSADRHIISGKLESLTTKAWEVERQFASLVG